MKTKLKDIPKEQLVQFEPKLRSRFYVEFPKEFNIQSYVVDNITKPVYNVGYFSDITINFIDPINPSTSDALFKLIHPEPKDNFTIYIKSIDPIGEVIETWMVNVNRIKVIDFGYLDYKIDAESNDFAQTVRMVLEPESCILL